MVNTESARAGTRPFATTMAKEDQVRITTNVNQTWKFYVDQEICNHLPLSAY